jgi:hypothetical protein
MDVLRTDPLTEARIALKGHVDPLGRASERVLTLAWLNSRFDSGLRSPLDKAILEHGAIDPSPWCKIDEVPLDFERRRVSVLAERDNACTLIVKGGCIRGCHPHVDPLQVLLQFLAEAVFMSVASGITGIVVGVLASKAISLSRAGKRRFLSWRLERDSCSQLA